VPLGQQIGEMVEAVRDRVEVSWHAGSWHITAGSFDDALAYARERFDDPVILSRKDRGRWWPRVTLVVTEDRSYAASAPSLDDLAHPVPPAEPVGEPVVEPVVDAAPDVDSGEVSDSDMPAVLEELFARQDGPSAGAHRVPRQRRRH
jgi:hypothetical protein